MAKKRRMILVMGVAGSGKTTYALSSRFQKFSYVAVGPYHGDMFSLSRYVHRLIYQNRDIIFDGDFISAKSRAEIMRMFLTYPQSMQATIYTKEVHYLNPTLVQVRKNTQKRQALGGEPLNKILYIKQRNSLEEPDADKEGFDLSLKIDSVDDMFLYSKKALFFSVPTVAVSRRGHLFPLRPQDVLILPETNKTLSEFHNKGYLLIGVANIPGISGKLISDFMAQNCLIEIIKQIQPPVEFVYYSGCSESDKQIISMPNPYFALNCRDKFGIDLERSIVLGSTNTERAFAKNAGIGKFLGREFLFKCHDDENDEKCLLEAFQDDE